MLNMIRGDIMLDKLKDILRLTEDVLRLSQVIDELIIKEYK